MNRWEPGMSGDLCGVPYRIQEGRKFAGDMVLEWFVSGQWHPVPMRVGFLLADFFFENEELAYPRTRGFRGGYYYLGWVNCAGQHGWEEAQRRIELDRRGRDAGVKWSERTGV